MKFALVEDLYNKNKVWIIKKYKSGNIYYNQQIEGKTIYCFTRTTKKFLKSMFKTNEKALVVVNNF